MRTNVDLKENIFFNERLRRALPYQIRSYDAVFPLTRKEFEEIKRIYPNILRYLDEYGDTLMIPDTISQLIMDSLQTYADEFMFACFDEEDDFIWPDFEGYIMKDDPESFRPHRWFYPITDISLPSELSSKLELLSEVEFKSFVLNFLNKVEINFSEKQTQFLLYFLELDVFYNSGKRNYRNSPRLFSSEKTNDLTKTEKKIQPFDYHHMTSQSMFEKIYYDQKYETNALNDFLDFTMDVIEECIPYGEHFTDFLTDKLEQRLWNKCREEHPELYEEYKLHKVTPFVKAYYDDMKNYLLDMLKVIGYMVKNFSEIDQIKENLTNFRLDHFVNDSTYSLRYINQNFMNDETEKFDDYISKCGYEFELGELFVLNKSYGKFIYDSEMSNAQKSYLEKYFEPLYDTLLEKNEQNIKKEFECMLNFYLNEIKKFTLNSNSISGIKLEIQFESLMKKLLMLDAKKLFQLYFNMKDIKDEKLLTLTEWFNLMEKMISKHNIDNKKEYKKYILKP